MKKTTYPEINNLHYEITNSLNKMRKVNYNGRVKATTEHLLAAKEVAERVLDTAITNTYDEQMEISDEDIYTIENRLDDAKEILRTVLPSPEKKEAMKAVQEAIDRMAAIKGYQMDEQTILQIKSAVGMLENSIRYYGSKDEETDLDTAIEYVYRTFTECQDTTNGYHRAVRFDGKKNIIAEITKQIKASEYIKLKA